MPPPEAETKSSNAAVTFDYEAGVELFMARRHRSVGYLRFDRAADAIRFAIEDLPTDAKIRPLCDCAEFPLAR
jgi:hypothetical protein